MKVKSFKMQTELEYDKDSYVPPNSIQLMSLSGVARFSYHWHAWPKSGLCMFRPTFFTESLLHSKLDRNMHTGLKRIFLNHYCNLG
jgi:hypothetical protein